MARLYIKIMSKSDTVLGGCFRIIISFILTIIILILLANINRRTKTLEQRTRFLIEKDTLIIREISGKEYYYR